MNLPVRKVVMTKSKSFSLLVISLLLIMALYASRAILLHIYKDTFIYLALVWLVARRGVKEA